MSSPREPRPPGFWGSLARALLRGEVGRAVRADLDDSFVRDLERGKSWAEARRRYARNVLGSVWSIGLERLTALVNQGALLDLKLGIRMLRKQPVLTGVAMLALGLGIPAALSLHHVLGALLSPLPVPEGHRVVGIRNWSLEERDPVMGSIHDYEAWKEALASFESVGAVRSSAVNLHGGDPTAPPVRGAEITASALDALRARPLHGRLLSRVDEVPGAPNVVILSENVWASRYGRDPDMVGKTVRVGPTEHTVVGIMPAAFRFPLDDDVWLPLRASSLDYPVGEGPELFVFGRLADGVTREQASREIELITERQAQDHPDVYERLVGEAVVMSLLFLGSDEIVRNDPELLLGQTVMLFLLFIVCGNVGTLVLARTATRTGEISIRTALGASRRRIVTQVFIEALVLATVATGLGLIASEVTARWLMGRLGQFGMPYWMDITLGPETIAVALGLAIASAAVASVIPALKATANDVQSNLQRTAAGKSTVKFGAGSTVLIVSEVILSVGFLAMGGTLLRTAFQDREGLLGLNPDTYLTASVRLPWVDPTQFPEYSGGRDFAERLRETQQEVLRQVLVEEEVRGAAMTHHIPVIDAAGDMIILADQPADEPVRVGISQVDVDFFRGLNRPILEGRDFTGADVESAPTQHRPAVIVNASFVDQVLEGRSPIGRRFRLDRPHELDPEAENFFEIVGVVGPFGMNGLNPARDAGVYVPIAAGERNPIGLLIEVEGDPAEFAPKLRQIAGSVDPAATVPDAVPLSAAMDTEQSLMQWATIMLVALAGIAFLLSVSGLYALMSFTVSQRTREIGIRTALGARQWSIVRTIARRAAFQLGVGLALGSLWALVLLRQLLDDPGVLPMNIPVTIGTTVAIAGVVGMVACASPTLKGLRIQPVEALRES